MNKDPKDSIFCKEEIFELKDKSMHSFVNAEGVSITPSEVLEYLFCPRFIYFMEVLKISQHEDQRYKVQMGRKVHEKKMTINRDYLRRKTGVEKKEISVYLVSEKFHIRGIMDEVLTLTDGTMAPMEYKFSEYKKYLYKTYRTQLTLQAIMIQENYGKEVLRGYIVFTRSRNCLLEVPFKTSDFAFAEQVVYDILKIVQTGYFPKKTSHKNKCIDCCYKNICV